MYKPGAVPVGVRQNDRAFRHIRLPRYSIRQPEATARSAGRDCIHNGGIVPQLQPEQLGGDFPRDVVSRRTKTAGDENDV